MSYSFSEFSLSHLSTCHPELQILFHEVIKVMDCRVLCGHRTKEAQDAAYPKYSKVKWPDSKHNTSPSMAVDVVPYPVDWAGTNRMYYFGGRVVEIARRLKDENKIIHEVRWGGDWDRDTEVDDQRFIDLPHFELVGDFA